MGAIGTGSFQLQTPDFGAPGFQGDIVVPGGGGKLNVAPHSAAGPGGAKGPAPGSWLNPSVLSQRVQAFRVEGLRFQASR